MAQNYRLRRFSSIAVLKKVAPKLLLEFLGCDDGFKKFLISRGLRWPAEAEQIDYGALAGILMNPGADTPDALLDALFFIDEMSDPDCHDRILEECRRAGHALPKSALSPEDLALHVWLLDRNVLERVHAEQYRVQPKRFESYYSRFAERPAPLFSAQTLSALEDDLNQWFDFKKRGRGSRVFPFPREDCLWLLVRHGERMKREGTLENDGGSKNIFYRPEKFDVLIY